MFLIIRIGILLTILSFGIKVSAQYPVNISTDSMMVKSMLYQKNKLNLSDSQYDACLNIYKTRQQCIDSLDETVNTIEQRGKMLKEIERLFYQQMKAILSEEQWSIFIHAARERKKQFRERTKENQIPEKELSEIEAETAQ